jgi:uncharacterized protein with HEPN domain
MRSPLQRLQDARAYALLAYDDAHGLPEEVLAESSQPLHAALYCLMVMGDALGKVPDDIRSLAPGIPRGAVTGMRNYIAHAYWQIDQTIVAGVLENRLLPLVAEIDKLIDALKKAEA